MGFFSRRAFFEGVALVAPTAAGCACSDRDVRSIMVGEESVLLLLGVRPRFAAVSDTLCSGVAFAVTD